MRHLLLSLLILLLSAQGHGSSLLVLGDSLSAGYGIDLEKGWVSLLSERLKPEHVIINRSITGDATGGGLSRLPALLQKYEPDFVLIELGGNDGLRGHPLSRTKKNLRAMIDLCREMAAQPILISVHIPPNYGKRYTDQFANIYPSLAHETEIPLISFGLEELVHQDGMLQADGIHPTEQAQPVISNRIARGLKSIIK